MEKHLDWQLINIVKVVENDDCVDYLFCCTLYAPDKNHQGRSKQHQTNFGRMRIIKVSGEVELIHPMPDDDSGIRASRTGYKLNQHWQKGEFPNATMWASG